MKRANFIGCKPELTGSADEPVPQSSVFMQGEELARLLTQALGSSRGGQDQGYLVLQGPLAASAFSQVFRAEGGGVPRPVVVKQFVRDPLGTSAAAAAKRYFFALKKISEIADKTGLDVSEPLLLLERHGIVVASWIDGPALSDWLFRTSSKERLKMLDRAGAWLARLHRETGVDYRVPDVAEAIVRLEREFAESADRSSSLMLGALTVLRSRAKDFEGRPVPWSRLHGDFKPANLIVNGDRVVGIDFDLAIQAPCVNDAAHFLNHLQGQFYTWQGLPRWYEIGRLTECFAHAYARAAGEELDATFLAWCRLHNALHLVLSHRSWSDPAKAWLVGLTLRHQLKVLGRDLISRRSST